MFCIKANAQREDNLPHNGLRFVYKIVDIDTEDIQKIKKVLTNRILDVYNQKPKISYDELKKTLEVDIPEITTTHFSNDTIQFLLRSKGEFGVTLSFRDQEEIHDFLDHVDSLSRKIKIESLEKPKYDDWLYSRFEKIKKPPSNYTGYYFPFYGTCLKYDTVYLNKMLAYRKFRTNNSKNIGWLWGKDGKYGAQLYAYNKTEQDFKINKKMIISSSVELSKHDKTPLLEIELNTAGGIIFKELTARASLNKRYLHIHLDDRLLSSPSVMNKIEGGILTMSMGEKGSQFEMKCIEAIITNESLPFELPYPELLQQY